MRTTFCGFWIVGALLVAITAIASADDAKDEAIVSHHFLATP